MNKKSFIIPVVVVAILMLLTITSSYSAYRSAFQANGTIGLATWNVVLNQEGIDDDLTIIPVTADDTYTLNITSTSKVDIKYTIVISNLPEGVKVALGEGEPKQQNNEHVIMFEDAGTILYNDTEKTKSHTLTFSAVANTTPVDSQEVNIDVIAKQIVNN